MVDSSPVPSGPTPAPQAPKRVEFPPTWHAVIFGSVLVGLALLVVVAQEELAPSSSGSSSCS